MTQGMTSKSICFLIGAPRSGTTWLQRLLQAHPDICGGEESHFFRLFTPAIRDAGIWEAEDRRDLGPLAYIDRQTYDGAIRDVWAKVFDPLYQDHPQARVHLEKTPEHALCIPQIVQLFPNAKFVFLLRDSRAVTSSLLHASTDWGHHWAPDTARTAAATWRRYTRVALKWHKNNPDHPFHTVRYEDLVADTEGQLDQILRFVLPDASPVDTAQVLAAFEAAGAGDGDVSGFARKRGATGWKTDLTACQKLVVWKETRTLMRSVGYDIRPF
jgi:hypothetical protein